MTQTFLRIAELSKNYGQFEAVKALSLEVHGGEVFGLLGPNGAGKTTTIRMLMGILQATAGTADIRGLNCFSERAEVMRYVGYLPDEPVFYDYLRGREIIHFVGQMHDLRRPEIRRRSEPLLERLDLSGDLEEYAVNYSRGMKKKLAVVCALMHEPELLIMDEPTNGLDPYATRTLHELIRDQVGEGRSVFLSTHLLDQAQKLCDRIGILHQGRLVALGSLAELRRRASQDSTLEEVFFAVTSGEQLEDHTE